MTTTDQKIAEVLSRFGEPMAGNVWRVQGTPVIYHKCLERIAVQARIAFEEPTIIRADRDEAVILVKGRMGDRLEWSIGEAVVGVNYRISGKQAAYVWAMAEKRAKDRVILKLIELHGLVYSEEEADEVKDGRPDEDRGDRRDPGAAAAVKGAFGKTDTLQVPPPKQYKSTPRASDEAARRAYVSLAKSALLNAITPLEMDQWWVDEKERRKAAGVLAGTPEFEELADAFKEHKQELKKVYI